MPCEPLDASIRVKLMLAESSLRLDLSECDLTEVPPEVFDLPDLEELSLAGNRLHELPPMLGRLTALRRLQLSGNQLETVPEEIGHLQQLEGLWLHGNLLQKLPSAVGALSSLTQLSLAGNQLMDLPDALGHLSHLKDLNVAGNNLSTLPASIGGLASLEKLTLHGNQLTKLPSSIAGLMELKEIALHGNPPLSDLSESLAVLSSLEHLSAADCGLASVSDAFQSSVALRTLSIYGNSIECLPPEVLHAPSLQGIYMEANPLQPSNVAALLSICATSSSGAFTLGLDARQVDGVDPALVSAASDKMKISQMCGVGPGCFKLEKAGSSPAEALVVAFGSAPGTPNWGGLLRRVRDTAADVTHNSFDVLYVVDPYRSWYGGGNDDDFDRYAKRLAAVTSQYRCVIMLGDSMGATAALMLADQATSVHAFCPQVDLSWSSIRPGKDAAWGAALKHRVLSGVGECKGKVTIHVGNWKHDLDQVNLLPQNCTHVQIYSIDSHRLAAALDRAGKLLPMLRAAISHELGLSGSNVRISNLF